MTARTGDVIEWSVTGEDPEPWIADLAPEWSREDAERYQRRHGGTVVCREVPDWHVPGEHAAHDAEVTERIAQAIEAEAHDIDCPCSHVEGLRDAARIAREAT